MLETFLRASPFAYRGVSAPLGTTVCVRVTGEAGGVWSIRKEGGGWELRDEVEGRPASAVTIDQSDAWLLFTRRTDRATARARFSSIRIEGATKLGETVLEMVAIMA